MMVGVSILNKGFCQLGLANDKIQNKHFLNKVVVRLSDERNLEIGVVQGWFGGFMISRTPSVYPDAVPTLVCCVIDHEACSNSNH